ncbi:ArsC/Spx/MgsR family protein [Sulfitobacter sp. HNIBRBA3233]|uniref:arsenate reductase family protein n=1 Tax=Sulfitobacter marinivivus TaxID=3158558 RepID=UPI0032DEAD58
MILYGLPTCSACKTALKALTDAGHTVTFRDVRADRLSEAEWATLLAEFGDTLVDRSSQTYRNLNAWMRESEAEAQLLDQPALMARPVLTDGTTYTLGWDDAAQEVWLAR